MRAPGYDLPSAACESFVDKRESGFYGDDVFRICPTGPELERTGGLWKSGDLGQARPVALEVLPLCFWREEPEAETQRIPAV